VPEHTRVITAVLLIAIGIVGPFWGENVYKSGKSWVVSELGRLNPLLLHMVASPVISVPSMSVYLFVLKLQTGTGQVDTLSSNLVSL